MSKRELGASASGVDVDSRRAKRRKDGSSSSIAVEDSEVLDADTSGTQDDNAVSGKDNGVVGEQGLKVWHILKNAVNKEGRALSNDFLRLPSKRQYADYYVQIKRPISLDEIKAHLDANAYPSLDALRQDLETCFKNAKKYNMRESQIWRDAKALQKIANKELDKLTQPEEDETVDVMDDLGSDEDGRSSKKRKSKAPNMTRLLKSKLQKLINKTDAEGRILSNVFMDLPSKKKWPLYYKTIKRPICLEDIFRKVKRREYGNIQECVDDVDLVFSNALQFNEDHTPIWEDAIVLKGYFHQVIRDLPPPYGPDTSAASKPSASTSSDPPGHINNKIVLKVPMHASGSTATAVTASSPETGPGASVVNGSIVNGHDAISGNGATTEPATVKAASKSPSFAQVTIPTSTSQASASASAPKRAATTAQTPGLQQQQAQTQQTPAASTATYPFTGNYFNTQAYYPSQIQGQTAASVAPSHPTPAAVSTSAAQSHASTPTPSVIRNDTRPIRSVRLTAEASRRKIELDSKDGVRNWALRLADGENRVVISDLRFFSEISTTEGETDDDDEEEEEDESSVEEVNVNKRGRRGRRKAGLRATVKGKDKEKKATNGKRTTKAVSTSPKHTSPPPSVDDILIKLNGSQIKPSADKQDEWTAELSVGNHVLEMGHKEGMVWKVYLQRTH